MFEYEEFFDDEDDESDEEARTVTFCELARMVYFDVLNESLLIEDVLRGLSDVQSALAVGYVSLTSFIPDSEQKLRVVNELLNNFHTQTLDIIKLIEENHYAAEEGEDPESCESERQDST